ncbi:MAG: MFS transporter [Cyanobacteriota bacterium]
MPVFFLFFASLFSLDQVLWLLSIYYVAVSVLEVPSGYFSDHWGRKITLVISSLFFGGAFLLFAISDSFVIFTIAQIFVAGGYAFASGTDTSYHYEVLLSANREDEYLEREVNAAKIGLWAGGLSAVIGGLLALLNYRIVYIASFIAILILFLIILRMKEPIKYSKQVQLEFFSQVWQLMKKALNKNFCFLTLFVVFMTVLVHIPYEFYQPYLKLVKFWNFDNASYVPLIAGIHLALTKLIGVFFTQFIKKLRYSLNVKIILMLATIFQVALIFLMAIFVHPFVVFLLLFRGVGKIMTTPIINAELSPQLIQDERSTFYSLQSLLGRLSHGVILAILPVFSGLVLIPLQGILWGAALIGLVFLLVLLIIQKGYK